MCLFNWTPSSFFFRQKYTFFVDKFHPGPTLKTTQRGEEDVLFWFCMVSGIAVGWPLQTHAVQSMTQHEFRACQTLSYSTSSIQTHLSPSACTPASNILLNEYDTDVHPQLSPQSALQIGISPRQRTLYSTQTFRASSPTWLTSFTLRGPPSLAHRPSVYIHTLKGFRSAIRS